MRGHLQQRGADSWRLKVFLGRSPDGKKRYLERTVRGTRREADQELARLVVEAGEGRWAASAPMAIQTGLMAFGEGASRPSATPCTPRTGEIDLDEDDARTHRRAQPLRSSDRRSDRARGRALATTVRDGSAASPRSDSFQLLGSLSSRQRVFASM